MEREVSASGAATASPVAATAAAARERAGFLRGQVIPQGFTYIDVFVESFEHRALGPKELSRLLATLRTLDQRTTSLQVTLYTCFFFFCLLCLSSVGSSFILRGGGKKGARREQLSICVRSL